MGMIAEGKVFVDRRDAGYEVGKLLEPVYKNRNVLVLGIPRGGVEVAYEVANVLNGELSVVVTKKLPHPMQPELAVGAVAEDFSEYLTGEGREMREYVINDIIRKQHSEIENRVQRFRKGRPLPEMKDRIVILVDDGIATGATLVPAIKLCRRRGAGRIVVAAPVSGKRFAVEISILADEVAIVQKPDDFYAVAQVYDDFQNLSDEEVVSLLENYEKPVV